MTPKLNAITHYTLTGVLTALWGASLPATDARLDLGEAKIGALLLALSLGVLAAMPAAGWLADRFGGRGLLRATAPAAALALAAPMAAPSYPWLLAGALLLGTLMGALNVALTVRAVAVERAHEKPVISLLHGMWTLGAVAGGAATTAGLHAGVDARTLVAGGGLVLAAGFGAAGSRLTHDTPVPAPPAETSARRGPGLGSLVLLGVIGAAAFLTEGAATDWAAIHAGRELGADPATASMVYTAFFAAMTAMRFAGDAVRSRLGAPTTVLIAGVTASLGYVLVLAAPALGGAGLTTALAGWILAGVGMAVVWPVVTSTLGASGASGRRLSAVGAISYGGGLAGPAVIGFTASVSSLSAALVIPAVLALVVALAAPSVLRALTTVDRPQGMTAGQGYVS
ncbi:MFS transporter [Phytomonospora endophytica]|uniref:MFS family permease n=1 Tax=Phytomonospora endophytica TaxID=714109 RepID=A0A841FJW1_9ACTN|nr:MFS transporter [Phytomonospora endophytica]MBB6036466.1 MFS family permease [Phytomonospora endophytica]GIG65788.1 MFS transporter [Phytomonospora endophytica]